MWQSYWNQKTENKIKKANWLKVKGEEDFLEGRADILEDRLNTYEIFEGPKRELWQKMGLSLCAPKKKGGNFKMFDQNEWLEPSKTQWRTEGEHSEHNLKSLPQKVLEYRKLLQAP